MTLYQALVYVFLPIGGLLLSPIIIEEFVKALIKRRNKDD